MVTEHSYINHRQSATMLDQAGIEGVQITFTGLIMRRFDQLLDHIKIDLVFLRQFPTTISSSSIHAAIISRRAGRSGKVSFESNA